MDIFREFDRVTLIDAAGNYDENDPNHEGRIVKIEQPFLYVTNTNMPYMGTMINQPIHYGRIITATRAGRHVYFNKKLAQEVQA